MDKRKLSKALRAYRFESPGQWLMTEFYRSARELEAECQAKQARIDELMLEFCPDEMTEEQMEEWAKHQRPVKSSPQ